MRLTFVGTRANIDVRTPRHRRHAALLITGAGPRILVDCGADWLGRFEALRPDAIVLTHAHPDHAFGLAAGAPCPVYATAETWERLRAFPVAERRFLAPRAPADLGGVVIEAFPLEHSTLAPAVGFRITSAGQGLFYAPDVAWIADRPAALSGLSLYVGDGSSVTRPLVRRRDGRLIGHAAIRTQIHWCQVCGVARAVFTHCGTQIVEGDGRTLAATVRRLGRERGVDARIATDGLALDLPEA